MIENKSLFDKIVPSESELKEIIVNYVGNTLNPDTDEITIEQVIDVFADQFPELLLAVAEENWINGYTQALSDSNIVKNSKDQQDHDSNTIHRK